MFKRGLNRKDCIISRGRAEPLTEEGYRLQLLPAVFFTCFILLISRMMQGASAYAGLGEMFYLGDNGVTTDFYFYWKAIAVYVCTAVALAFFGYRALAGKLWVRRSRLYFPLAAYLALVFLSFCFSEHRNIAWLGADGRYGGAAVILCCGFMFFYIFNSVVDVRSVKWFIWPLTACLFAASILGLTQAVGHDFFKTVIGQKLLVPNIETASGAMAWDIIDSFASQGRTALEFVFDRAVYQTVGNPNYVALYMPLVLPLFAFLFLRESCVWRRVIWAAAFGLIMFNLFASQSFGAVVGAGFVLFACLLLSGRRLFSVTKPKLALVAIVIICVLLNMQTLSGGIAKNILESAGPERAPAGVGEMAAGTVDVSDLEYYKRPAHSVHKINRILTGAESVEITIDGESFILTDDPQSLAAAPYFVEAGRGEREDGTAMISMMILGENRVWQFVKTSDGYRFVNDFGKLVKLREVDSFGSDNHLYLGTGRVYIWSRTLPLLKDTILLGRGPDTFMLYFPQDDYVGRYNGSWDFRAVFDKPHNLYLDIAFGSGVLSLAFFVALVLLFLMWGFRLYRARGGLPEEGAQGGEPALADTVGRGVFAGVTGFLAAGMFYDGATSVMPLFWGLLALGAACNRICERNRTALCYTNES